MTIYRWTHDDVEHTAHMVDGYVSKLAYQFNRTWGLGARLQQAIADDCKLALDSLSARKLKRDARELRRLAHTLDRAVEKLTRE